MQAAKEDGEVIVMLHNLFAVEEMVLKRADCSANAGAEIAAASTAQKAEVSRQAQG